MNKLLVALTLPASLLASSVAVAQSWDGTGADPMLPAAPSPQPTVIQVGPNGAAAGDTGGSGSSGGVYFYNDDGGKIVSNNPGPTPELHVVRRGDTLWDICSYYFNDAWQWPKIWSYNAQISNPHWIYPGDLVRLLPKGVFVAPSGDNSSGNVTAKIDIPPDPRSAPSTAFSVELRQLAFLDQDAIDRSVRIDGSVDEKQLLSLGDAVFLTYDESKPPKVGDRMAVFIPGEQVKSKGKAVGSYVRLLGTVQITEVRKDKRARGIILDANEEIERGARLGDIERKLSTSTATVQPKVDLQANIVALVARGQLIGQGEVVFIDAGEGSGLVVGNRMLVVRRGDALIERMRPGEQVGQNDKRFPARALGEVVIVEVGKNISIGLVTLAVKEMGVGDHVIMSAAK